MREYSYKQRNESGSDFKVLVYKEIIYNKDDPTKYNTKLFEQIYFE